MMTFSDAAIEHFTNQVLYNPKLTQIVFDVKKTGCSGWAYEITGIVESVEVKGELVLDHTDEDSGLRFKAYIAEGAGAFLNGLHVDVQSDGFMTRTVFINPNEKAACGCGESFTI